LFGTVSKTGGKGCMPILGERVAKRQRERKDEKLHGIQISLLSPYNILDICPKKWYDILFMTRDNRNYKKTKNSEKKLVNLLIYSMFFENKI
jgi:hypothetical protein